MPMQTIRNGQSIRLNIPSGQSVAVVAVSGTYNASITAGAGIGVIATAATGGTYGPYTPGVSILLTPTELSRIDFDVGAAPVIKSDVFDPAISRAAVTLTDAAATLTAAQMVSSGIFTITPTITRIVTIDTAVNIIAALPRYQVGVWFDMVIVNNAAFDVTLVAGAGVTLVGKMIINNVSASFRARVDSATAITIYRM